MSCPTQALPALAALLASGGAALLPDGEVAPPETPKEMNNWQQLQHQKSGPRKEDLASFIEAETTARPEDSNTATASSPSSVCRPAEKATIAAVTAGEEPVTASAQEGSSIAIAGEEVNGSQQQHERQEQEEAVAPESPVSMRSTLSTSAIISTPSVITPEGATPPTTAAPSSSPARRGSDRTVEWHPLDAVVERIESNVRPGAGEQRIQWTKGFRMPLGAEGRQILLRRLRKAYHSNPVRWDEELARHRIVFSRMPYATVIELFHLAHLLGVFDFAVKCSEEYGSDAAGGATHRKRRPARTGAAVGTAGASQQSAGGENGPQAAVGAGEEGAPAHLRQSQGERKRSRRASPFLEGACSSQMQSARPKRARRFSPAYLRDYETLAESFRLPPPPAKKGRSASHSKGAGTSANSLLDWNCTSGVDLVQLQQQDDLLAAALGGRECASAHENLLKAVEEQTAVAATAATRGTPTASYASHPAGSLHLLSQPEFDDKHWNWGAPQTGALDGSHHPSLHEHSLGNHPLIGNLGGSLEGEIRDLSILLQQEQHSKKQQQGETDAASRSKGRVFFSAELPGGAYEEFGGDETDRQQKHRCSGSRGNSTIAALQQRRNRRTKAIAAISDNVPLVSTASSHQPTLAEMFLEQEIKNEGNGSAPAAPGETPKSQLNLHLLTTNYTIAAQYLQVIELLAVQRQIMELTQSLNKKRRGDPSASVPDAVTNSQDVLAASTANPNFQSSKLDYQSLLNQQLILRLGAEAGLTTTAHHQAQQSGTAAAAAHASILKDLEKKVSALESLAAERNAAGVHADAVAKTSTTRSTLSGVETKCKRDVSRQSALSCSAPESPVDGYESAAASPCCSGSSSFSACNTPDSLGGERLLLLSSLWQPLPPAEGLAGANL